MDKVPNEPASFILRISVFILKQILKILKTIQKVKIMENFLILILIIGIIIAVFCIYDTVKIKKSNCLHKCTFQYTDEKKIKKICLICESELKPQLDQFLEVTKDDKLSESLIGLTNLNTSPIGLTSLNTSLKHTGLNTSIRYGSSKIK